MTFQFFFALLLLFALQLFFAMQFLRCTFFCVKFFGIAIIFCCAGFLGFLEKGLRWFEGRWGELVDVV